MNSTLFPAHLQTPKLTVKNPQIGLAWCGTRPSVSCALEGVKAGGEKPSIRFSIRYSKQSLCSTESNTGEKKPQRGLVSDLRRTTLFLTRFLSCMDSHSYISHTHTKSIIYFAPMFLNIEGSVYKDEYSVRARFNDYLKRERIGKIGVAG